jgi:hypothetical protein
VGKSKTRHHLQSAALPFKYGEDGWPRVMLLTSRETKRWVIPKGWPTQRAGASVVLLILLVVHVVPK